MALVIAETENVAQDAAELIAIDYETWPDADAPRPAQGAIRLHENLPDNLAFEYEYGNRTRRRGLRAPPMCASR